jgi:large conductance mechanosensitive channel
MKRILDEFKAFIMKGNVVQLAVAVVIGAAFNDVVKSVQENIISPLLGAIGGQPDFSHVFLWKIKIGAFLNSFISFLITAAAVFFVIVKPMNKLMAFFERKDAAKAPPATLDDVVAAIKDLQQQVAELKNPPGSPVSAK